MNKIIILLIGSFSLCLASPGQSSNDKVLFVIDSIPLMNDPEDWNPILPEDIADIFIIKDRDSLKQLGWERLDAITYIFTKNYRARPDSIKAIPSLKQMKLQNGAWTLHNKPFSGKYRDYYNSGRIQNEGELVDGKLNGKLVVYFKHGVIKSESDYKEGVLDGIMKEYYKNGMLSMKRGFTNGRGNGLWEGYFINGQIQNEKKIKKLTSYDTLLGFYSTGKISGMSLVKNGIVIREKHENDLNYHRTHFSQSLLGGDLKAANRHFYQLWRIDSTSAETHLNEGMLLARELKFDEAIIEFDNALALEPLMRNALVERGLARLKKFHSLRSKSFLNENRNIPISVEDFLVVPENERVKICNDLQQADDLDTSDYYVKKQVTEPILNYCRKKSIL